MLDNDIIQQLRSIFADLGARITLRMSAADPQADEARQMKEFLGDFASSSPDIDFEETTAQVEAPQFEILKDGEPTGVKFVGIPNGHEFTTLLLAVLNACGKGKNMPDDALSARIQALRGPIDLRTFVSLTCTNCPDVAQALNVIAILNPEVSNSVIDGAVVQPVVDKLNIQSVPTVYAGDAMLGVGRQSLADLIDKLEERYGKNETDAAPVEHEFDVVVLGGGPAGAAAAIYAARKGAKVAVVAKAIGGQVKETMGIENLISVPETTGPKLASDLRIHLEQYPIAIFDNRSVDAVEVSDKRKTLRAGNESFSAPALIVATGASWRKLNVPGEEDHIGKGVAFCTHCDGPFYAGKKVAVIGGGNSGIEAAIDLAGICPDVQVFEFMDTLKADEVLQEKAESMPNMHIHTSMQVMEVEGGPGNVTGLKVKDRLSGQVKTVSVDGVFVQIGLSPNSALFKDILEMTRAGEIKVDERCRTSVKGIYAAGDVTSVPYKQIIIAMGEGAKAALTAFDDSIRGEI